MIARLAFLAAVVAALPAWAYRPFDQTDAGVAEPRHFELELGPVAFVHQRSSDSLAPTFIFNYGLLDRWELVLDGRNSVVLGRQPVEARRWQLETALLAKGVLRAGSLQDGAGPSVAIEVGALLPSLPDPGGIGASAAVIVSQRWPVATVHFNGEAEVTRDHEIAFTAGAIVEGPASWTVRPVGEILVSHENGSTPTLSGLAGAIWRISDGLSLDVAARLARVDREAVFELRAGFTVAFGL